MAFPDDLKPVGRAMAITPAEMGLSEEVYQDLPASEKMVRQQFETPEGKVVTGIIDPKVGKPLAYTSELPGKKYERIFQNPETGEWQTQVQTKTSWSPVKDILSDEKFMSFLLVAGAGAAAGMYTGATGTAGITAGTGATPGTAGAVASSSGAGGVVGTGGGVLSSAAPITTAVPSAGGGSSAAAGATNSIEALQAAEAASAASSAAPAATVASNAATAANVSNGLAPAQSWYSQVFDFAKTAGGGQLVGGIVSGIGSGIASHEQGKREEEMLDKKLAHESAESDKAIAAKSRNFQGSSYAKINWGDRPSLTTEMPKMRNSGSQLPIGVKLSPLGVLERERRGR